MFNQKGVSSLVLLFVLVLAVFIIWETTEYIGNYNSPPKSSNCPDGSFGNCSGNEGAGGAPICDTGEEGNCNDSNDVFILTQ